MNLVVLPDRDTDLDLSILGSRPAVLTHRSGRPWIVGHWDKAEALVVDTGRAKVALFGAFSITPEQLRAHAERLNTISDVDDLAQALSGSFHLVAEVDRYVRCQGTISNARQFFHASSAGATVCADRPSTLAALVGQGIDRDELPLLLLAPFGAPWPLSERTPWKGVRPLSAGEEITLAPDGTSRRRRWWTPPEPELSLEVGAGRIRETLREAVAARAGAGEPLSSDFSGGMDSTTLAFLATELPNPLTTLHTQPLGEANDDSIWASRARAAMPLARHVTIPRGSAPPLYAPLSRAEIDPDGPSPFSRARGHYEHQAAVVAKTGARYHLGGVGGDELFHPQVLALSALARSRPLAALPQIRRFRHRYRWSLRHTLAVLGRVPTYAAWLGGTADRLDFSRAWGAIPETDWEVTPRMPPWATEQARESVREHLRAAAQSAPDPLSSVPAHHAVLRLMQTNGKAMRMNNRITAVHGVSLEAPFTDDRVIEAALSVRWADRFADGRPKAVLAHAVGDLVPHVFDRETKGDASAEIYDGLRRQRRDLVELCDESLLADEGLIDPAAMRKVLTGLHSDTRPLMPFDATLGLELWLRRMQPAVNVH